MKLEVTGIETIEVSDPQGLCNTPTAPIQTLPSLPGIVPGVGWSQPIPSWHAPWTGDPLPSHKEKWGVGLGIPSADKWSDKWQVLSHAAPQLSPEQMQDAIEHGTMTP